MTLLAFETEFWYRLRLEDLHTRALEWSWHANAVEQTEVYSTLFFPPLDTTNG